MLKEDFQQFSSFTRNSSRLPKNSRVRKVAEWKRDERKNSTFFSFSIPTWSDGAILRPTTISLGSTSNLTDCNRPAYKIYRVYWITVHVREISGGNLTFLTKRSSRIVFDGNQSFGHWALRLAGHDVKSIYFVKYNV